MVLGLFVRGVRGLIVGFYLGGAVMVCIAIVRPETRPHDAAYIMLAIMGLGVLWDAWEVGRG